MERIYLLGMPGSGKSSIGKKLARCLQWDFCDLDDLIEQKLGMPIRDVFAQEGEDFFREEERKTLRETILRKQCVIALGGGTPCFFDNMDWILAYGFSLYLKAEPRFLLSRINKQPGQRPLFAGMDEQQTLQTLENQLQVREPYYSRSNVAVPAINANPEVLLNAIPPNLQTP